MLIQYIRDEKKHPVGVMASDLIDGTLKIGFSLANVQKGDRFRKDYGKIKAVGRMHGSKKYNIPHKYSEQLEEFEERSRKYFRVGE